MLKRCRNFASISAVVPVALSLRATPARLRRADAAQDRHLVEKDDSEKGIVEVHDVQRPKIQFAPCRKPEAKKDLQANGEDNPSDHSLPCD